MERLNLTRPFELKDIDNEGRFNGYGSVFNEPIPHPFYGTDYVRPGAFAKALSEKGPRGIKLLWSHGQHEVTNPVGEWTALVEDGKGLKVRGQLFMELSGAADRLALLRRRAVDGLSIGFNSDSPKNVVNHKTRQRELREIDLWEISLVAWPADSRARVSEVFSSGPNELNRLLLALRAERLQLCLANVEASAYTLLQRVQALRGDPRRR